MKSCFQLMLGFFLCWSCQSEKAETPIRIAAAANMQFVISALVDIFEAKNDLDCEVVLNSSGKLSAQIQAGAPYDLFLSADEKYPVSVCAAGWCGESPKTYAFGQLVLWTSMKVDEVNWSLLDSSVIQHIAIANPKTAPYGRAAREVMEQLQIWEQAEEKIVMGESVAQTNQFLLSGAAQAGLTARSAMGNREMNERGRWIAISRSSHQPIRQDAVLLRTAKPEARLFYDFLFSEAARQTLKQHGYYFNE
ncbi:MAG: molybdate ABC transporter substrate-binding protein [Bacteroidota bacterium]